MKRAIPLAATLLMTGLATANAQTFSTAPTSPKLGFKTTQPDYSPVAPKSLGEGAHFECHYDKEHRMEFCDIIVIVCPQKGAECIELP